MIQELRKQFNATFSESAYADLLDSLERRCSTRVEFRVAETPIFLPEQMLDQIAQHGAELAERLIGDPAYLGLARQAIPGAYRVANETAHPHFLTADFALVKGRDGALLPKLVEIQAFPSVFGYQAVLCDAYREIFHLGSGLSSFLSGLNEETYWELMRRTVVGDHAPENVVLTEVDPQHQKTLPDFNVTAGRLGIQVVDIASLHASKDALYYRNTEGLLVPISRIYNRAIVD